MKANPFSPSEVLGAVLLALIVEVSLVGLVVAAGNRRSPAPPPRSQELSVAIRPVMDLPLLKKGGKKDPKKLPDLLRKPKPVQRVEQQATPTPLAKSEPPPPRPKPVVKRKKRNKPPPPDVKTARKVDDMIKKMKSEAAEQEPNLSEEGAADGAEEGTEADPLKARAVSLYRLKLIRWFKRGFKPTTKGAPCDELRSLKAQVSAKIGGDRSVSGFIVTQASGNSDFDGRVHSRMDASIGKKVPPPPPNYPDVLNQVVRLAFSGKDAQCD